MYEYGISPNDVLKLTEFEDFDWFIQELDKKKQRVDIKNKLDMLEVLSVANGLSSKKGYESYKRYHRKMTNKFRSLGKKESFFDKIRNKNQPTLFDKLKEMKNGV